MYSENKNQESGDMVQLTKRQATLVSVAILFVCVFMFIIGYFVGKKSVLDEFAAKVSKESFADQVEYAFASQALHAMDDAVDSDYDDEASDQNSTDELTKLSSEETKSKSVEAKKDEVIQIEKAQEPVQVNQVQQERGIWYAKLIGFGSQKSASAFADRLQKKGVEVRIKTHMSKTASGKKRTWYQALTGEYTDKKEFDAVLDKIISLEHLKRNDIQIVQTDAIAA
ncbi:SPOR domain-containing protein [bacterium]|nr:SPOR domain-containing protein [bacterium]